MQSEALPLPGNVTGWGSPYHPPAVNTPQSQTFSMVTIPGPKTIKLKNRFLDLDVSDEDLSPSEYPNMNEALKIKQGVEKKGMSKFTGMTQNQKKKLWKQKMTKISEAEAMPSGETAVDDAETAPLHYLSCDLDNAYAVSGNGGQFVETVVDSGATSSVISSNEARKYGVTPSSGSEAGQCFLSASGSKLRNEGQKYLPVVTEEGQSFGMTYQVAAVTKGLTSVGELCDEGDGSNFVVFHRGGGYIACPQSGSVTGFNRSNKNGAYLLKVWVPDPAQQQQGHEGFPRQG